MLVSAQWLQRAVLLAREIATLQETIGAAQRALVRDPRRHACVGSPSSLSPTSSRQVPALGFSPSSSSSLLPPQQQQQQQQPTTTPCSYGAAALNEHLSGLNNSEWGRSSHPQPSKTAQLLLGQHLSSPSELLLLLLGDPPNGNDVCAWLHRLQLARRLAGDGGVLAVFHLLCETRCLPETRGPWAAHFWDGIMQVAVKTPEHLQKAVDHALWMADAHHHVLWPDLYATVMTSLLENRRFAWAQKYHLLFAGAVESAPKAQLYLPDAATLSAILQRFILHASRPMQKTLRIIYREQPHRTMYDKLIPLAYGQGTTLLARRWRRLLVKNGDLPAPNTSSPSRPFLLYMEAFFPEKAFAAAELDVLRQDPPPQVPRASDPQQPPMSSSLLSWSFFAPQERGPATDSSLDRHYAAMFATRSFSLDDTARVIRHDGVDELRPLVIQALARRERDAPAIARALDLFDDAGISLGGSTYGHIVRRLAEAGKTADIATLLWSDIHPDVYDDHRTIIQILHQRAAAGDLEGYRHLLTVVLAAGQHSTRTILNRILGGVVGRGMRRVAAVLDDMAALDVCISEEAARLLFADALNTLAPSWRLEIQFPDHGFVAELLRVARRLYEMGRPIPSNRWRYMIYNLGQRGRIENVEAMCFGLLEQYRQDGRRRWIPVSSKDVPPAHMSSSLERLVLPSDLSPSHAMYPLKHVFTSPLVRAIVRWGFTQPLRKPILYETTLGKRLSTADFDIGRGVRLMHELQKRGLRVFNLVPIIRNTLLFRLASLQLGRNRPLPSRIGRATSLNYLRKLLDDAHGSTLLPEGPGLQGKVNQLAAKRELAEDAREFSRTSRRDKWRHQRYILAHIARRMGRTPTTYAYP